jgi:hypothetical protein
VKTVVSTRRGGAKKLMEIDPQRFKESRKGRDVGYKGVVRASRRASLS